MSDNKPEVDHSLFKVNNLRSFTNDDKDKTLSFGCYSGKMNIAISRIPYVQGTIPANIQVTNELRYEISKTLKNILEHPVPNTKFPIKIVKWVRKDDGKLAREIGTVLSFGIDDRGIGFIAAKVMTPESPAEVKVALKGPRNIDNEDYTDPISATIFSFEELKYFVDEEWANARLLTTNNITPFKPQNRSNQTAAKTDSSRSTDYY